MPVRRTAALALAVLAAMLTACATQAAGAPRALLQQGPPTQPQTVTDNAKAVAAAPPSQTAVAEATATATACGGGGGGALVVEEGRCAHPRAASHARNGRAARPD